MDELYEFQKQEFNEESDFGTRNEKKNSQCSQSFSDIIIIDFAKI